MNKYILATILFALFNLSQSAQTLPFSVNNDFITVWDGEDFQAFFVKGVNLGVARPGTYPGEMDATAEQYRQWFAEIREAVASWTHALRREGSFLVDLRDFDGVRLEYHRQVGFAAGLGMTRDVGVGLAKQIIGDSGQARGGAWRTARHMEDRGDVEAERA